MLIMSDIEIVKHVFIKQQIELILVSNDDKIRQLKTISC